MWNGVETVDAAMMEIGLCVFNFIVAMCETKRQFLLIP